MATIVYVDGLNLYYGALKQTSDKWLDLCALFGLLLPSDTVVQVKYFTARVKALQDPQQPVRQQMYLRALRTLPNVEIIFGQFYSHVVSMPLADGSGYARVIGAEEKGSDVALAAHLVHDAHLGRYDTAVVVSNDSDLVPPIEIVKRDLGKRIGVLSPRNPCSFAMAGVADFVHISRAPHLRACQFPAALTDKTGVFHKPSNW